MLLRWSQVTYPYIMAKVRIQTRTADLETERELDAERGLPESVPHGYHHKHHKHHTRMERLGYDDGNQYFRGKCDNGGE